MALNRVVLVGNLTKDPELRSTPDGASVATLRLAVNRPWANKQGKREADFFTVIAWRKLAELCGQYLSKGSPVAIDGRLQSRNWETSDGQKRFAVEVVADNVQFLSRATGQNSNFNSDSSVQSGEKVQNTQTPEPVGAQSNDSDGLPDDDIPF